jgi:hypothetical protein
VPSFDGGDNFIGALGPAEGMWISVGFGEKPLDGGLEFDDGSEHAAFEPLLRQLGEIAFDGVEPGCGGGGEVERPAWMTHQPLTNLGMLVGGVVVRDGMDDLAGRHGRFDRVEEADELLMAMLLHATTDDCAIQHVEGSKQRGGAVPDVVMCHGAATAFLHGQTRLSAIERLNLALLIDRKDDGMRRGIDVEPDDVSQLGGKLRVIGPLEKTRPVRSPRSAAPDHSSAIGTPRSYLKRARGHGRSEYQTGGVQE